MRSMRHLFSLLALLPLLGHAQQAHPAWKSLLLEQRDGSGRQRSFERNRVFNLLTGSDTLRGLRFTEHSDHTFHFMDLDSVAYAVDTRLDTIHRLDAIWFQPVVQRFVISGFGSVLLGAAITIPYAGLLWALESQQAALDALKVGGLLLVVGFPPIYLVTRKTRLDTRNKWRVVGEAF